LVRKSLILGVFFCFILLQISVGYVVAVLYDFEDEAQLDDWTVLGDAEWTVEDGILVCTEAAGTRQQQRLELNDIVFTDGTIEFKIRWISGTYLEGGVFYRLQDDNNWYNTHLSNVEQSDRWMAMVGGALDWTPMNLADGLVKDTWYELKVEVDGDSHIVSVDGEVLHEKTHNEFTEGKFAIGTWSAEVENWHLDDLQLEGPGIPEAAVDSHGKLGTTWGIVKGRY
jgi:hypothetical protein